MLLRSAAALAAVALSTVLFVPAALALDAIDLSEPPAAPAAGECPALVKIKYPFLRCTGGGDAPALVQARPLNPNPSWESARQIPRMSDWTESDGTFGPDLNQD